MRKIRNFFDKILNKRRPEVPLINQLEDLIESDTTSPETCSAEDASELELVSNVLGLKDLTAEDIMVPRADIVAARVDATLDEFIDIFSKNNYSQIPIYKDTLDNVVGIVRVRDFLPYIKDPKLFNIQSLLKEVIYVVPTIQLMELLVEIRKSANHMALVIDEFGGIDGLVTLQDLIAEIVGEIQQNQNIFPNFITRPDGSIIANAKMLISECEAILGIDLTKPLLKEDSDELEFETIGGLVMSLAGHMPTRGEIFNHPSGIVFEVIEASPRCVKRIAVKKSSS